MRTKGPVWRLLALLAALALFMAACGDDDEGDGDQGAETEGQQQEDTSGALSGLRGTTPLLELSQEFKDRLLEIDPELSDFNYGAESYDAVVLVALATLQAETDGIDHAKEINGLTIDGEKCETFEACSAIIEAGGDVDYDGASGPLEFSVNGEPRIGSYGILNFGDDNRVDDAATEYEVAEVAADIEFTEVPVEGTREGDGTLKIGTLLPETGSLAFLGPPEYAGVDLAAEEINAAGGVLGQPIEVVDGDSGDTESNIANQTVDRLLGEDVDAIVGAASSSVTLSVIDKVVNAGVTMFSPANTSKKLSTYADKGLYFRDAPSDILQSQVLAGVITGDGNTTVAIMALDDDYGTGFAEDLVTNLTESGAEVVIDPIIYDPKAQSFDSQVEEVVSADPEAIVVIGFDESSRVLNSMVEKGIGPADKAVYGTDGNMGNALGENFDAGK